MVAEVRLEGLSKDYGAVRALAAMDLTIEDGELMTLLGPSGSGKTTALRLVAGFITPSAGSIGIGATDVTTLPPEKRDVGMVFQSYALFPHRTVFGNIAFGLERRNVSRSEIEERVARALTLVRLDGLAERRPDALSGGQQQRVALARALVIEPTVLLLDEPLSNLDASLRGELRLEIRRIQKELRITTILVTHDQEEALSVSDRMAVLADGVVQQVGAPDRLYRRPENRFVAEFVGKMNVLPAARIADGVYRLESGDEVRVAEEDAASAGAHVAVRPESIALGRSSGTNHVSASILRRVFLGELTEIGLQLTDGTEITVRNTSLPAADVGDSVELSWPIEATRVLPS